MQIKVVSGISQVPREAWNALLLPLDPPVLRWEWLDALESSGSTTKKRGWEATHFTLWRGPTLIGAAPAWLKHHSMGEYVYDFAWANAAQTFGIDYYPKLLVGVPLSPLTARRFICAPGEDEALVRRTLLEAVLELGRAEKLSSVHVIFPPAAEADALQQLGLFRRLGMQYHWSNPGYRTYDDYLARFDSKRRHQLKHERALSSAGRHCRASPLAISAVTLAGFTPNETSASSTASSISPRASCEAGGTGSDGSSRTMQIRELALTRLAKGGPASGSSSARSTDSLKS